MMNKVLLTVATLVFAGAAAFAQETPKEKVKEGFKEGGRAVGQGAKDAGHGIKKGAKKAGKGVKKGAKEVGHGVKDAVHKDKD
jgi:hypothetical protein